MNRAQLTPETLGRLARVLTGRYGVTVSFDTSGPRVECERIVLPEPAPDATDAPDADALTGQLDLLAARWKFSAIDQINALPSGPARQLADVIEDRRVCERLFIAYPGARGYIEKLRAQKAHAIHGRWPGLPWRDKLIWLIEGALWDEQPAVTERTPALVATLSAVSDALDSARASRSTLESIEKAHALVARIRSLGAGGVNTMMFTADADDTLDAEQAASDPDAASQNEPSDAASGDAITTALSPSDATAQAYKAQSPAAAMSLDLIDGRPRLSIPLTTAFDVITDLTGRGDPAAWRNLRALARAETAPLTARLERALKADEQTHWRREQERGEIDRPALAKLVVSPGYRTPFRVKRVTEGRYAAVSVLIDLSGSMAGKKMDLARLCAAALCDALIQLSFKCEVLGYSSVDSPEMRALYEQMLADGDDLSRFNRKLERLDLRIYKRFGSNNPAGLSAIDCGHENPDGEALIWAAERLLAQRAGRRILMILSDGYPATGDGHPVILRTDLRARIEEITASGIELVGIGLLDDAVEKFYAHNIVVRKLDELPTMAFAVLSNLLLEKRG
jgi:cobalamin biosynthesis protein CobT